MEILHYTAMPSSSKYGGVERWFVEFCKQSAAQGHKVHIVYTEKLPVNEKYIEDLKSYNASITICRNIHDIVNYINSNHIQIVFCHFNEPYEIGPYIKKTCKVKLYQFLHCYNYYYDLSWIKNFREKLCSLVYRKSVFLSQFAIDGMIAVSDAVIRQFSIPCGVLPNKIRRVYLGVPRQNGKTFVRQNANNTIIIGCVAFHAYIKGVDILIHATEILKNRGVTDFEVWQIGGGLATAGGCDTEKLHQLVRSKHIEAYFKWFGIRQDIDALMSKFDIYVQPSRNEAISLTIAEAMSHSLPVVASNVGGIPEYIKDGITGLLYNSNSPEKLADKLQLLIENQLLRTKLGDSGFEYINSEKFDITKSVEKVIRNYCNP